jgi:hypothetical protein
MGVPSAHDEILGGLRPLAPGLQLYLHGAGPHWTPLGTIVNAEELAVLL